jgi:hypothetical protein
LYNQPRSERELTVNKRCTLYTVRNTIENGI